MSEQVTSSDTRLELDAQGKPLTPSHRTEARMTNGLIEWFQIDGRPAAAVGSSGPNTAEHQSPKMGQTLVPLSTKVVIRTGDTAFQLGGKATATTESRAQVPDVMRPIKGDVVESENSFFFVNGVAVFRGES